MLYNIISIFTTCIQRMHWFIYNIKTNIRQSVFKCQATILARCSRTLFIFFILHYEFIPLLPPNNLFLEEVQITEKFHMHSNFKFLMLDETSREGGGVVHVKRENGKAERNMVIQYALQVSHGVLAGIVGWA